MDNALGSPFAYVLYDGTQILRYVGDEEEQSEVKLQIWSAGVEGAFF